MNSRAMPASLVLDAYTADEFGPKNAPSNIDSAWPRGSPLLAKSKFTTDQIVAMKYEPTNLLVP